MSITRASYKGHGKPGEFMFFGSGKAPSEKGIKVISVAANSAGVTLIGENGRITRFGTATKFWMREMNSTLPE